MGPPCSPSQWSSVDCPVPKWEDRKMQAQLRLNTGALTDMSESLRPVITHPELMWMGDVKWQWTMTAADSMCTSLPIMLLISTAPSATFPPDYNKCKFLLHYKYLNLSKTTEKTDNCHRLLCGLCRSPLTSLRCLEVTREHWFGIVPSASQGKAKAYYTQYLYEQPIYSKLMQVIPVSKSKLVGTVMAILSDWMPSCEEQNTVQGAVLKKWPNT